MDNLDYLKKAARKSYGIIAESVCFMGMGTEHFMNDPVCLIRLGLSLVMDKPIFFLFPRGYKVPGKFINVMEGYEFYDPDIEGSFEAASDKLMERMRKHIEYMEGKL